MQPAERCPTCHQDLEFPLSSPESDFDLLLQLCDLDPEVRTSCRAIRPEATTTTSGNTINPRWERAVRMVYNNLCQGGKVPLRKALWNYNYRSMSPRKEEDPSKPKRDHFWPGLLAGLRAVAAILYDQECSGQIYVPDSQWSDFRNFGLLEKLELKRDFKNLFRQMALLDYGIDKSIRANFQERPNQPEYCSRLSKLLIHAVYQVRLGISLEPYKWYHNVWVTVGSHIHWMSDSDPADLAIMMYHFESHLTTAQEIDSTTPICYYTGVLKEMIGEIPERGTERLLRKLSTDVSMIHRLGMSQGEIDFVGLDAERIADEHGLCLWDLQKTIPPRYLNHLHELVCRFFMSREPYFERRIALRDQIMDNKDDGVACGDSSNAATHEKQD